MNKEKICVFAAHVVFLFDREKQKSIKAAMVMFRYKKIFGGTMNAREMECQKREGRIKWRKDCSPRSRRAKV
jgi:hypothetical protein